MSGTEICKQCKKFKYCCSPARSHEPSSKIICPREKQNDSNIESN